MDEYEMQEINEIIGKFKKNQEKSKDLENCSAGEILVEYTRFILKNYYVAIDNR